MIQTIIEAIATNKEFFGILIPLLGVVIPLAIFILSKNKEQKQLSFERFHKDLMYGLANQNSTTGLDQQVAIIFELRNYKAYYPVIRRLLNAQISRWHKELKDKPHYVQLIDEANETIAYTQKNILSRHLNKYFSKR